MDIKLIINFRLTLNSICLHRGHAGEKKLKFKIQLFFEALIGDCSHVEILHFNIRSVPFEL